MTNGTTVSDTKETELTLDGHDLLVEELIWSDGGRSFDVTLRHGGLEIMLTMEKSLDSYPSEEKLRILLERDNLVAAYEANGEDLETQEKFDEIERLVDLHYPKERYSEDERIHARAHLTWHGDDCGC